MTAHHDYAFPNTIDESVPNQPSITIGGLTKREYFAALALQGLLSDAKSIAGGGKAIDLCKGAVSFADILIAELNAPICPDCKQSNADNHYDAEHNICPNYERAWSEAGA